MFKKYDGNILDDDSIDLFGINVYLPAEKSELKEWKWNMLNRYSECIQELEDEKIKKEYTSATFLFCLERLEIGK